jgi:hypothetical protein
LWIATKRLQLSYDPPTDPIAKCYHAFANVFISRAAENV